MAALLQYGYLLYIKICGCQQLEKSKQLKGGSQGAKADVDLKHRLQRIDRHSFVVFPICGTLLSALYWILHLVKYSQDG